MADLFAGAGHSTSETVDPRTASGPPGSSSGMRTPTEILRQRGARDAAREARKLEAGAAGEEETRTGYQFERRRYERQSAEISGTLPKESGYRHVSAIGKTPVETAYIHLTARSSESGGASRTGVRSRTQTMDSNITAGPASHTDTARLQERSRSYEQPYPSPTQQMSEARIDSAQPPLTQPQSREAPERPQYPGDGDSLLLAFKRWEDLSIQFEGTTSYWNRRLEANANSLNDIPMGRDMQRQMHDLTAAGANLFHAVVEIQRTRASSERRFARWYKDAEETNKELKKIKAETEGLRSRSGGSGEISQRIARLESDIRKANVIIAQLELDNQKANVDTAQMQRELQITREEARRAWEELGRRESDERNRIALLYEGHPISVGGIQVVPTTGIASRGGSLKRPDQQSVVQQPRTPASAQPYGHSEHLYEQQKPSPTDTDPFSSGAAQPPAVPLGSPSHPISFVSYAPGTMPPYAYSPVPSSQQPYPSLQSRQQQHADPQPHHSPSQTSRPSQPQQDSQPARASYTHENTSFVRKASTSLQNYDNASSGSGGLRAAYTEEEDHESPQTATHAGTFSNLSSAVTSGLQAFTDAVGITHPETSTAVHNPDVHHEADSDDDDYDSGAEAERERALAVQYTGVSAMSHPRTYELAADYEGAGYGDSPGRDVTEQAARSADPRHHHPTRLSDVLEEDERSRTTQRSSGSGSGASRGGVH